MEEKITITKAEYDRLLLDKELIRKIEHSHNNEGYGWDDFGRAVFDILGLNNK